MIITHLKRGGGKTTIAIEWLLKDPKRIMLTFTLHEEDRLKGLYPDLADRIVYWKSYVNKTQNGRISYKGIDNPRIMVDNADMVLQDAVDWNITDVTFTKDEIGLRNK